MEATASELFAKEDEIAKEVNDAHRHLDDVMREIIALRNQIDVLRTNIRNKEGEALEWKKVIRSKKQLKDETNHKAWEARNSGA